MEDNKTDLSVILPCYQEAENLKILLPELNAQLEHLNIKYEILVVDGMFATDNSARVCEVNNVSYINQHNKHGYGAAVKTGIELASGNFIIFMDGDGLHKPATIPQMWALREDYDVIIASRYVKGAKARNNFAAHVMSKILNLSYRFILGMKINDISTSFKLYRAEDLKNLHLSCANFDIIEEILFRIHKNKPSARFKEIPVSSGKRLHGTSKRSYIAFIFFYIVTLFKLRLDAAK